MHELPIHKSGMDRSAEYDNEVNAICKAAEEIENAWIKLEARNAARAAELPSEAITSSWKERSAYMYGEPCVRCSQKAKVKSDSVVKGCRMNGDGYGACFSTCSNCGFLTWRSYDEAD